MSRRNGLTFALAGALAFSGAVSGAHYAAGQEADCGKISEEIKEADKEYKHLLHEQKKAFENWDKYYTQLHSDTYAGTEEPIADTAEKCESGEDSERFCEEAMKLYNQILKKEQETKKVLDAAKEETEKARGRLHGLREQAKESGCE